MPASQRCHSVREIHGVVPSRQLNEPMELRNCQNCLSAGIEALHGRKFAQYAHEYLMTSNGTCTLLENGPG